ncbi:DUF3624 family protein [Alginatibacterium sediminis]|uniref:DUF3624 family protein n=1 Tax=Alginatibacterium sediminis TaxID=2164068 RepID=A0A420EL34_9ALTE|nr:DUF3624 family protein [Alginatibacterium sediminis]
MQDSKTDCGQCQSPWFRQKLGRCRQCFMWSSIGVLLFSLIYIYWDTSIAVYQSAVAVISICFIGLWLAHLFVAIYLRLIKDASGLFG